MKAFQQNPVIVQQWISEDYPQMKALAKKEGAEIYFEDGLEFVLIITAVRHGR
jgi:hypothetical protein